MSAKFLHYFFLQVLGKEGLIAAVFVIVFLGTLKNSNALFDWIEKNTYGNRDYILQKCDLLMWKVNPDHVNYLLLGMSFGLSSIVSSVFIYWGRYVLAFFVFLCIAFLGWKIPKPLINYFHYRRMEKYKKQMVDALNLLAGGIRAGLSLQQACGLVVDELPAPISQEFNFILQQNRLGIPIDECFQTLYKRVPTEDNQMFVSCISVLRETGGNLAEIFDTIIEVIRERIRLDQKVKSMVEQGKTQGAILCAAPIVMLLYFSTQDEDLFSRIFSSTPAILLLSLAFAMIGLAAFFIKKIITIKV
jgi:tight adherence protein B